MDDKRYGVRRAAVNRKKILDTKWAQLDKKG